MYRRHVVIPLFEGDQSGCCIKNALKPLDNSNSGTNTHTVAVVHTRCYKRMNEGQGGVSFECAANRAPLFQFVETRTGNVTPSFFADSDISIVAPYSPATDCEPSQPLHSLNGFKHPRHGCHCSAPLAGRKIQISAIILAQMQLETLPKPVGELERSPYRITALIMAANGAAPLHGHVREHYLRVPSRS